MAQAKPKCPAKGYYPSMLDQTDPIAKVIWDKNIDTHHSQIFASDNLGKQWSTAISIFKRSCAKRGVSPSVEVK